MKIPLGKFTRNTIITFSTRLLTGVFGVLITVVMGRHLSSEGLGIYSLAILMPNLLLTFSNFGLNSASVFYLGKKKYPEKEVIGNNLMFASVISILAIVAGFVITAYFGNNLFPGVDKRYIFVALSLIPFSLFFDFICNILIGLHEINKYNFVSFIQVLLCLIITAIALIGFNMGIQAAILSQVVSILIALLVSIILVKRKVGILIKFNRNYFKDSFSYGLKIYLGSAFDFVHHRINILLINLLIRNPVTVGLFYIANKLAEGIWIFSISASTVLFPKVASQKDTRELREFTPLVYRNVLIFNFFVIAVLAILAKFIIGLFYSDAFLGAVAPFRVLLIGTLFFSGWVILSNDLTARGKPLYTTYIIVFSALLNIVLNVILIPQQGIMGAAWASAISYFIMLVITIVVYAKASGNKISEIVLPQKTDFEFYRILLLRVKNLL